MTGSKDNRIPALKKTMLVSLPMALLLLAGCRGGQSEIRTVSETMRIMQAAEQPAAPMPTAEPSPVPACETCAFSDGLDRFIDCYNSCCTALGNTNLLKDRSYWQFYGDCWHYRQFEDNWLEPEFQVLQSRRALCGRSGSALKTTATPNGARRFPRSARFIRCGVFVRNRATGNSGSCFST